MMQTSNSRHTMCFNAPPAGRLKHSMQIPSHALAFRFALLFAVLCVLLLSGCARKQTRAATPVSTRPPMPSVIGATEEGVASWYGHPYHGRRTANGEVYDQEKMTAAHPSLAFNVWVDIENLDNGKRTQVRINDRGPFVKHRAIDLSRAAARAIDMLGPGTALVRVTVIPPPAEPAPEVAAAIPPEPSTAETITLPLPSEPRYALQAGAFRNEANARQLQDALAARAMDVRVLPPDAESGFWRVWVGKMLLRESAEQLIEALRADFPRIFLVSDH